MFRFRSIPAAQRNVVGPAQLAQLAWAAFKGVQHVFPSWEHALVALSELSPADYEALDAAVAAALPEPEPSNGAEPEVKPQAEPSDAEKKSGSISPVPSPDAGSS